MLSEQSFPYLVPRRGASPTRLLVVPTRFLVVECPLPGFSSWSVPTWFLVVARPLPGSSSWCVPLSWRVPYLVPHHGASPTRFLVVARPLPGSSSWRIPCPVPRHGASPCFPSQLLTHSPPTSPTGGYSMRQTFIPLVPCWVPALRMVSGACEVLS